MTVVLCIVTIKRKEAASVLPCIFIGVLVVSGKF